MKAIVTALACATLLAGCSFKGKWHDKTSQNRGQTEAKVDYDACFASANFPARGAPGVTNDILDAAVSSLKECMAGRGWEMVRDDAN
jgi:hypothetical protein